MNIDNFTPEQLFHFLTGNSRGMNRKEINGLLEAVKSVSPDGAAALEAGIILIHEMEFHELKNSIGPVVYREFTK